MSNLVDGLSDLESQERALGNYEAADFALACRIEIERLRAVYEAAKEVVGSYPMCNYRIVNGNQVELIGLGLLGQSLAAVEVKDDE